MKQKLIVTSTIELTEGDFTKNVADFITDLEREVRNTWGHDADGGYEGPFVDSMTTKATVTEVDGPALGTPAGTEYGDPEVTLTRNVTRSVTQKLVVHASEIGYLDYGLMAQGHALLEQLGALDTNTRGVIERIEERVFFSPDFEDRIVEETNVLTIDDTTNIEIKD